MTTYNQDGTPMSGAGSNQLLDLLSVVSNPDAYNTKIQALQDAINEHKKVIDAVGPAKDILALREQTKAARDEAAAKISIAQTQADGVLAAANAQATAIVNRANEDMAALATEAKAATDAAKADAKAANKALKDAEQAKANADAVVADYTARSNLLVNSQAELEAAIAGAKAAKDAIINKHLAFIQGL
jgi:cell division septum initiation protein DivIVA